MSTGERVFARLPLPIRSGELVTFDDGTTGVVETAKIAADLRDAKCVVVMDHPAARTIDDVR